MNSKQRRKSRRYWQYDVVMDYKNEDLDPWDARYWLEENMGKIGIRWGTGINNPWTFYFKDGRDANFFMLKWL